MSTFERGIDPIRAMRIGAKTLIIDRAKEIFVDLCGDDIDYSKTFKDNDLDILDYIEIIMNFEKEWSIELDEDDDNLPMDCINMFFDQIAITVINYKYC